ncbi:class I SAM-dependent methyltransferase [Streptomyces mobaraensis]|uniref:class I SAM-dependent methyltransferase n=1 Tax=Streptomyces mobaraensis TaxID=35621 RepID=UPI0033257810
MTDHITDPASYWGALWSSGRRYSPLTDAETALLDQHAGPGHGRLALDVGCGDGALARHLASLGYQVTGLDCTPAAPTLAEPGDGAVESRCLDIEAPQSPLPGRAYALFTARLVYAFIKDKSAFLGRIRGLLVPGGLFWVVTPMAGRLPPDLASVGITRDDEEVLTSLWGAVRATDLGSLRCYALRQWGNAETRGR